MSITSNTVVKSQNTYLYQWEPKNNGPVLFKITICVQKLVCYHELPIGALRSQLEKVGQTFSNHALVSWKNDNNSLHIFLLVF